AVGNLLRAGRWRPSLAGAPLAAAPAGWPQPVVPVGGHPLRVIAPAGGRPLQVADSPLAGEPWTQPTTPCIQPRPALPPHCSYCERVEQFYTIQSHHTQFKTNLSYENLGFNTTVGKPTADPDGEDEVSQASSSLVVSTRWISAAKLLQSDLVTLVQREGGE
ncbi:hypothetical protein BHM03_00063016, partial [Ensete ventricosum]